MDGVFSDNAAQKRFEYKLPDGTVIANYRLTDSRLYIDYVEAPPSLRGSGAAGQIMQEIVMYANTEKLELIPICGYAVSWLKRHEKD